MIPGAWRGVCVAFLISLAGCQRGDPHFEPVTAGSPSAFGRWRTMASEGIKPEEWREFDAMLQEIRLRVTADRQASGSEAVEAAMRARIDGKSFNEVLAMGYDAKRQRIEPERAEIQRAMAVNLQRASKETDYDARREIERMHQRQAKRIQQLDAEIEETGRRLEALRPAPDAATPPVRR